jgi:ABC-type phosphate transport system ATPase subunit
MQTPESLQNRGNLHSQNGREVVIDCNIKELYYGQFKAVRDTNIPVQKNEITAFIGPSGCGKSTVLRVEEALKRAALWDEVKDKLNKSGLSLSGGQQQRLCIARAIATEPEVLLMDEPCSALDPIATRRIEELMLELKNRYTIAIVTHNLQQAQRVADKTGFLYVDTTQGGRTGYLVEFADSRQIFSSPQQEHTKAYISGAFS